MTQIERHPFGTPSWFDLMTPDVEKARTFYAQLFGWEYDLSGPEMGHYSMAKIRGLHTAGMGELPKDAPMPSAWTVYLATDNIQETVEAIKRHGGQPVVSPTEIPGSGWMAVCSDPTGAHFGLWQALGHRGAGLIDEPGAMVWSEVNTRDSDRARSFYRAIFGLETKKMSGMDYWTFHLGDRAVHGLLQMTPEWGDLPPHWMAYFAVTSADKAAETVTAAGGKVHHGPFDTPYGRIVVVSDPFGATFSVLERPR